MTKLRFVLILLLFVAQTATAQIMYQNARLSINTSADNNIGLMINEWPTMKWKYSSSEFLRIDLSPSNPRFSGSGDRISFYNSETRRYNSIQVEDILNVEELGTKQNIRPITSSLENMMRLRPVSYNWVEPQQKSTDSPHKAQLQYGFLAQEVEDVIPAAVRTDESGKKMVNYLSIIPLLVSSVQELNDAIEANAKALEELKKGRNP